MRSFIKTALATAAVLAATTTLSHATMSKSCTGGRPAARRQRSTF